jgi:hypothetical protein
MSRLRHLLGLALALAAPSLFAQTDAREQSYQFYVDGVLTAGVIGYQVNFNHSTVSRANARQLDLAYTPDQRILAVQVTQKGLNRLQDWINGATGSGTPVSKAVALVVRTADGTILVRWEFTNVTPTTVTAQGTGAQTEVDATVSFLFDSMTQTQAKAD